MKPIDVNSDSFAEYNEKSNERGPRFNAVDYIRISKYKNIFAKGYTPNGSEEVFATKKVKDTAPYVISDLNEEEIIGTFMGKSCKTQIKKSLE